MGWFQAQVPNGFTVQQLEGLVRTAVFKSANAIVGFLLQAAADRIDATYQPKPGQVRKGRETIEVQGIFGVFPISRDYYYHTGKKQGYYPVDAALGLEVGHTPALARLICLEGADEASYQKAENHLLETGGISVSARQIQRMVQKIGVGAQSWPTRKTEPESDKEAVMYVSADATGVPMRKEELAGRKGKQPDGTAKTRQAYLGCVFTQHGCDKEGHPVRDYESTTYVASFDAIGDFGLRLRQEALHRGMGTAKQVVLLIDGAVGLEHMGHDYFQDSVQIVDFYHAMEHAGKVLAALLGDKNHPEYKGRRRYWAKRLLKNGVEKLIAQARQECFGRPNAATVEDELAYFVNNIDRMQYGTFRAKGFFIGSGVIEAGCKTIIGARCKQSGMFWGLRGAEHVLGLRCIHASRHTNDFWKHRLNSLLSAA